MAASANFLNSVSWPSIEIEFYASGETDPRIVPRECKVGSVIPCQIS